MIKDNLKKIWEFYYKFVENIKKKKIIYFFVVERIGLY